MADPQSSRVPKKGLIAGTGQGGPSPAVLAAAAINPCAVPLFVATEDGKTIAGFYTLSAHMLNLGERPEAIARKLPRHPNVSATLLGRLAVGQQFRGRGLGEFLLMDALRHALVGTEHVASAAVVVDSKTDDARRFYVHYGFQPLPSQPTRLFYLMKTIASLFPDDAPGE